MIGERFLAAVCWFAVGFLVAYLLGARNGEQLAEGVADVVEGCDRLARDDMEVCLSRVELIAEAVHGMGERCRVASSRTVMP